MEHVIESPRVDDAPAIAQVLLATWLQNYPNEAAGIDEAWIREQRDPVNAPEGTAQWREFIAGAEDGPDHFFCRVVRCRDEIVGFLCGRREEEFVNLGPMYLLRQAQGNGIGAQLMAVFLSWAGKGPMRLWVTAYNERAIRFYRRYGFRTTDEQHLWRGRLPNVRMVRAAVPDRIL